MNAVRTYSLTHSLTRLLTHSLAGVFIVNNIAKGSLLLSIPKRCLLSVELAKSDCELCRRLVMEEIETEDELDLSGKTSHSLTYSLTHSLTHSLTRSLLYDCISATAKLSRIIYTRNGEKSFSFLRQILLNST